MLEHEFSLSLSFSLSVIFLYILRSNILSANQKKNIINFLIAKKNKNSFTHRTPYMHIVTKEVKENLENQK
jgi:hypothetical protein